MQVAEPLVSSWKARLALGFSRLEGKTLLAERSHDGPLVVQKPLYPEGAEVCHAIVVHPPGGIAGGDELSLQARLGEGAAVLLTTPGATKWYRSAGPLASQSLHFDVRGNLEWLPQEAIVFDGARATQRCDIELAAGAVFAGWDIVCLGRRGSGERFGRGSYRFATRLRREGRLLWQERGRIDGGGRLLQSAAGLGGRTVFGTLVAAFETLDADLVTKLLARCRAEAPGEGEGAVTRLPGVLLARYLGDSSESARHYFRALWHILRPALAGREARDPRIWAT
jgi:urease accessory protein